MAAVSNPPELKILSSRRLGHILRSGPRPSNASTRSEVKFTSAKSCDKPDESVANASFIGPRDRADTRVASNLRQTDPGPNDSATLNDIERRRLACDKRRANVMNIAGPSNRPSAVISTLSPSMRHAWMNGGSRYSVKWLYFAFKKQIVLGDSVV